MILPRYPHYTVIAVCRTWFCCNSPSQLLVDLDLIEAALAGVRRQTIISHGRFSCDGIGSRIAGVVVDEGSSQRSAGGHTVHRHPLNSEGRLVDSFCPHPCPRALLQLQAAKQTAFKYRLPDQERCLQEETRRFEDAKREALPTMAQPYSLA